MPNNIITIPYLNNHQDICKEINFAKAFVNFSFMDAAPKTVLQGLACELPVLYANSGGVRELVNNCGFGIPDEPRNSEFIPDLNKEYIKSCLILFKENFGVLEEIVKKRKNVVLFNNMLNHYFSKIKELV